MVKGTMTNLTSHVSVGQSSSVQGTPTFHVHVWRQDGHFWGELTFTTKTKFLRVENIKPSVYKKSLHEIYIVLQQLST